MLQLYAPEDEAAWLASLAFGVDVRVRYCECDGLGHVSNTVYPEYLEFGRLRYFIAAADPEPGPFAFAHVTAELQLRYTAASYYDETLTIRSKLSHLGRASATMEQAVTGVDGSVRALARVAIVRAIGGKTLSWTAAQRATLEGFEGRTF